MNGFRLAFSGGAVVLSLLIPRIAAAEAELPLVVRGVPRATIVLAAEPTAVARFAAIEIQDHVRKCTGVTLPIRSDRETVRGVRILVGESAVTRKLGLRAADFAPQEYLVRFQPDTVVLMGKDAPDPPPGDAAVHGEVERVPGRFGRAAGFENGPGAVVVDDCGFNDDQGSMEVWVKLPPEPQPREATVLRLDGTSPWTYHIIRVLPKSHRIMSVTYDGKTGHGIASSDVTPGWHYLLATHDLKAGKMELFVDGVSQGTADFTPTTCRGAALGIGGMPPRGSGAIGNPLKGCIDEVRISDIVRRPDGRSPAEPFQADAHTTLLLHFDEQAHQPIRDASGIIRRPPPPPMFTDQSTCYAVYDFLEKFCGVRWYGPTEVGLVCPRRATLIVAGHDIRRSPAFEYRLGYPRNGSGIGRELWGRPSAGEMRLYWCRLRAGGRKYAANHSFYGYYDRFWKKNPKHPDLFEAAHPDWFARGYGGKPPQMCYTNPEFIAQVVRDARDYFAGRGIKPGAQAMGDYFALVPMDNSLYCQCPRCRALEDKSEAENPQFSNGEFSDYIFTFTNRVARALHREFPHKYLSQLAYARYAYHPKHVQLEPNISVQMCLHVRNWWVPSMEKNDLKVYHSWVDVEKDRPLYLWLYYCFPESMGTHHGWHCFPGFFAHTAARQIRMFARDGIRGAFLNGLGEQVDTYVTFKMFDDPTLDVDTLLDEFFERYYGAAAAPMKSLYLAIEETYSNPANYPDSIRLSPAHHHQTEELAWKYLGTASRMAMFAKWMARARALASTEIEKKRVALFDKAIWHTMVEGRRMYLAKLAGAPERERRRQQPPPSVVVPALPVASAADEPLRKVDWSRAVHLAPWCSVQGFRSSRKISADLVHDARYLYVRLVDHTDTTKLVSHEDIWTGDDWELFFARRRAKPYYQIGINPAGDTATLAHGDATPWQCKVRVRSDTQAKDRWVVTVVLPLARILPGGIESGDTFFANFFRAVRDQRELLGWSPTFIDGFHAPDRLGELRLE